VRFSVYQVTRKGAREKNEDRMGYSYTRDSGLFALADGMGGHPEGEVASQLALQAMSALFQRQAKPTLVDPTEFLQTAICSGHQQLLRYSARRGLSDSPRTTVVACVLQGDSAYWAHCGDSRLYLVRDGELLARTRDHSYSEWQHSLNSLIPTNGPFNRNLLFTCLGSPGKPIIDSSVPFVLQAGDRLLLCSDGLWDTVSDETITEQLSTLAIGEAVPELVELALRNGGPTCDNVSVMALEWEGAEEPAGATGVSTLALGDEVYASTIQAGVLGQDGSDDLDDAEIERSIKEINDAIRRLSQKQIT
jgi:serine/threonine protein phosphatase PrpC